MRSNRICERINTERVLTCAKDAERCQRCILPHFLISGRTRSGRMYSRPSKLILLQPLGEKSGCQELEALMRIHNETDSDPYAPTARRCFLMPKPRTWYRIKANQLHPRYCTTTLAKEIFLHGLSWGDINISTTTRGAMTIEVPKMPDCPHQKVKKLFTWVG